MAKERDWSTDTLVLRVAAGQSLVGAARALKVSRRAAQKRAAEPGFQEAVRAIQQAWAEADYRSLCRSRQSAIRNMRAKLRSSDDRVSLTASVKLIELGLKLDEHLNVLVKLRELEALVLGRQQRPVVVAPPPPLALPPGKGEAET